MKKITVAIIFAVLSGSVLHAGEMSYEDIMSCYHKSYEHESEGKYDEAIADLKKVRLNYPDTYTVNLRLGWLSYLNKNHTDALEHLKKVRKLSPDSVEALNIMIMVYAAKEYWMRTEELCASVLKIDYHNTTANYWYSYSLKMQGKYDLAVKVDRKMLAARPTSVAFLGELGENLILNGQEAEGMRILKDLLILSPGNKMSEYYLNGG